MQTAYFFVGSKLVKLIQQQLSILGVLLIVLQIQEMQKGSKYQFWHFLVFLREQAKELLEPFLFTKFNLEEHK